MQSRITGTTMPVLGFVLEPNESVISEAGELSWMGSSIQMTTHSQFAGGGGLFGVLKRVAGGGSIFMTEYRAVAAAEAHCVDIARRGVAKRVLRGNSEALADSGGGLGRKLAEH